MTEPLRTDDKAVTELELKLQIPEDAAAAVSAWLLARGARRDRLRARYFDSANRDLAAAQMALRLRFERGRWIQTLKAATRESIGRFEHEVVVQRGRPDAPPPLDPLLHQSTEAAPILAKALGAAGPAGLFAQFETDIRRTSVLYRTRRGQVEVSLDSGEIKSSGRDPLRVCEVEVELVAGSPRAVTDVARQVVRRFAAWVDPATKAERGHWLAADRPRLNAVRAAPVRLDPNAGIAECALVVLRECRRQCLPNLAAIASESQSQPEHVHQARVALRRLRSAIRLFQHASLAALDAQAQATARALGEARKRDVVIESVAPALTMAGAPTTELAALSATTDARLIARQRDSQSLMLALIELEFDLEEGAQQGAMQGVQVAAPQLIARLATWHRQVRRDARKFETLDDEGRHRLRRRMKRLRYGVEFCQSMCADKRLRRMLRSLSEAQETLGRYNDLVEALASYRSQTNQDPRAWFAVGWLTAESQLQSQRCAAALAALRRAEAPWRASLEGISP